MPTMNEYLWQKIPRATANMLTDAPIIHTLLLPIISNKYVAAGVPEISWGRFYGVDFESTLHTKSGTLHSFTKKLTKGIVRETNY